jgi:hypothetical protein
VISINALHGQGLETLLIWHTAFVVSFEPKEIGHTLFDSNWVNAMHEELENLERNQVWELVEPPLSCKPIGTKWV